MTESFVIVDCLAAWRHAVASDPTLSGAACATTSPFVQEALGNSGQEAILLDGPFTQQQADAVGFVALDVGQKVACEIDRTIQRQDTTRRRGARIRVRH